jgi:hypothetical protein
VMYLENGANGRMVDCIICDNLSVIATWKQLAERAENYALPIIFFNGKGYTDTKQFMQWIEEQNQFSRNAGGANIYE